MDKRHKGHDFPRGWFKFRWLIVQTSPLKRLKFALITIWSSIALYIHIYIHTHTYTYTHIHKHTYTHSYDRSSAVRLPWIRTHSTEIQGPCRIRGAGSSVAEDCSVWGCDAMWLCKYLPTFRRHEDDGTAIFRNVGEYSLNDSASLLRTLACVFQSKDACTITESRGTARIAAQCRLCHFCMYKSFPTWLGILSPSHVVFSFSDLGWKTKRGRNACGLQNAQCFNYELLLAYEPVERGVLKINKWGSMSARTGVSAANFAQHRHEKPGISELFILTLKLTWFTSKGNFERCIALWNAVKGGGGNWSKRVGVTGMGET